MKSNEFENISSRMNSILEQVKRFSFNSSGRYWFDIESEISKLNEKSSLEEFIKSLDELEKKMKIQEAIIEDFSKKTEKATANYKWSDATIIVDGGNYYNVSRKFSNDVSNRISYCSAYSKEGKALLPFDENNCVLIILDENNFAMVPHNLDGKITHYRITGDKVDKIFECDYSDNPREYFKRSFAKAMGSWSNKGLGIVVVNGREYLYSFSEGKILSYGYSFIEVGSLNNEDYVELYDCCKAELEISSDIPYNEDEANPNITIKLYGYIDSNGELINKKLYASNGSMYDVASGEEDKLENAIKNELNEIAKSNILKKQQIDNNNDEMKRILNNRKK